MSRFILIVAIFLLSGCMTEVRPYTQDEIRILKFEDIDDGSSVLVVQARLESLYHLGGLDTQLAASAVVVSFVRCRIEKVCPFDIPLEVAEGGAYTFNLPHPTSEIRFDYAD